MSALTVVIVTVLSVETVLATRCLDPKLFNNFTNCFPKPSGTRQSPINIELDNTVAMDEFQPIRVVNLFLAPRKIKVQHVGMTVKYYPNYKPEDRPTLKGGPLDGEFTLQHIHFHWGATDKIGSEHTIDQKRYPLEMHLVFYNKQFTSLPHAMTEKNGLAVLGFLFQVKEGAVQRAFSSSLKVVRNPKSEVVLMDREAFSIGELLGPIKWNFASYAGSLTTEPFAETVTWLVNVIPLDISPEDLNAFRKLVQEDGAPLVNNYRELQPLADRGVEGYFSDRKRVRVKKGKKP